MRTPGRVPISFFLLSLVISGCASSHLSQEPGLVTTWDKAQHVQPSGMPRIGIVVYTRQLRFDAPVSSFIGPHWAKRSTQKQLDRVISEFAFLQPSAGPDAGEPSQPPPRLIIEATHATHGDKRVSWLSNLTKYIIPSSERNTVELEARLLRGGTLLKTYEAVGTYKTKKQLLFLLLPMKWGLGVPASTTAQTFRDVFLQVERDAEELLAPAVPAPATEAVP